MKEGALPQSVKDVMNTRPVLFPLAGRAEEAFALMQSRQVDTLLVVDGEGRLRGYVNAWHMARGNYRGKTVGEICEEDVAVTSPDEEASQAFARMDAGRHPYLAVVDGERLVGIVTRRSMVRALAAAIWGDEA